MKNEETTIRIMATFNDDKTHRYTLKRIWDESKPSAAILMSGSSTADIIKGDLTSMLIQNNLAALNYGSVTIVNLFSFRQNKLDLSGDINDLTNEENTEQILQAARESDVFIVAIGTLASTYRKVAVFQSKLFERLREFQPKLHTIEAPDGSQGLHVTCSKLRQAGTWRLVPFILPELPAPDAPPQEQKTDKKNKRGNAV
jgi:hypothetical protein